MRISPALLLALWPVSFGTQAAAHPHIFVDTRFEVLVDAQNNVTHIRVSWSYDDLYSLLLAEDFDIDQDGDGTLTPKETALITGFDMKWIPGYDGDLDAISAGRKLKLSAPMDYTAIMTDGIITTTHLRAVEGAPTLTETLTLKPYDAGFYTAYDVTRPTIITGGVGCQETLISPDIDAALEDMRTQIAQLDPNVDLEGEGFPALGEKFAPKIEITCPAI
ncbi:hypothetical protein ASD8599_01345 [Ascidiaceihabitans donghaensis]|uniref:Polyphosphate kinase n=1 Tax=Ascidiaceihabitans donghaensis TaxID=1510460 RepID=A0A2R8BC10_9RHOB|nr:DUF1007 family protein [Ascidiaceihabitans donghaensis]SPH20606.1 hypothetical protein ASD8599_01345 [Ascidiaceihabitans donghaensis]